MAVVLAACGGPPTKTTHAEPQRPQHGSGAAVAATETAGPCDPLIAHVIVLAAAERPAEQRPTDAERAAIDKQLRETWSPACQRMTRKGYDCALAATTLAQLDGCAP
jgi:hypothetical protein